jgi:hypothetical protein
MLFMPRPYQLRRLAGDQNLTDGRQPAAGGLRLTIGSRGSAPGRSPADVDRPSPDPADRRFLLAAAVAASRTEVTAWTA